METAKLKMEGNHQVIILPEDCHLERRFSNPKSPMTIMKNHKDTKDTKFFIMQFMNTESVF
jgi:hypothetical protein